MYRYLFVLVLSVFTGGAVYAQQADSAATEADADEPPARKKYIGSHQLTVGVDVFHPVMNNLRADRWTYEGELSYYLKNEYCLVADGGWGGSDVNYADLKYSTTNYFTRLGFNKSILYRESAKDWDMMFIGLRAAGAGITRSSASYSTTDSVWGNVSGVTGGQSFAAIWAEVTTGMRVELFRGLMAGWNLRGKFLMNGRSFDDLAPMHIAGFGKGDKTANFDFNLYLCYAIRWDRRVPPTEEAKKK